MGNEKTAGNKGETQKQSTPNEGAGKAGRADQAGQKGAQTSPDQGRGSGSQPKTGSGSRV